MAKAEEKAEEKAEVEAVRIEHFELEVEGIRPLMEHKFSDRSKEQMLNKQKGKTKEISKRDDGVIAREIEECIHRTSDGQVGFPAAGFKKAMVEAAPYLQGLNKKLSRGAFYVMGDDADLVPMEYKKQLINESVVRLSGPGRPAQVRFRPVFTKWKCRLPIKYNARQITPQEIIALANTAGFHIGVGDFRPQCSGTYGMFQVAIAK